MVPGAEPEGPLSLLAGLGGVFGNEDNCKSRLLIIHEAPSSPFKHAHRWVNETTEGGADSFLDHFGIIFLSLF
jgi:hypothetical protein